MLRVRYCDSTSFMLPQCNTVGNYLQKKTLIFSWIWRFQSKTKCSHCLDRQWGTTMWPVQWSKSSHMLRSYIRLEDKSRSPNLIMSTTQVTWIPRPYLLKVPPPFNIKHMDLCGHYPHPNSNIAHPLLCNSPAWESLLQISLGYASLIKHKKREGAFEIFRSMMLIQLKSSKLLASTVYPAFQVRDTQSACFKL